MIFSGADIKDAAAIILAAGQGKRMNSQLPKVLHQLKDKPLIRHVIDSLTEAGVNTLVAVVGYEGERVLEVLPAEVKHVWQREQLGTGHAVMQAEKALSEFDGRVVVACGDVPLISPRSFKKLIGLCEGKTKATLLTMRPENPEGYGRIVKDKNNFFQRIVEEKDASPQERLIGEVNTGTYVFDKKLLFEGLKNLNTNNAQREYYLTDVLEHILNFGFDVGVMLLDDPIEGSGINKQDELAQLERYLDNLNKMDNI
ncbi:MAG: NTP transferase domain-containing protein [Leptospirales bacterium]|nr:NTP transferase domain-containing protein [Leptospirales bacterium]